MTETFKRRRLLCGCLGCEPAVGFASTAVSRRSFLAGGAAAGLGASGLGMSGLVSAGLGPASAQPSGKPHRIDVHHHIVPPEQRKMNIERQGGKGGPAWSPQMSLDDMDKAGVAYSITSILNPGPWYGKIEESSRRLARECNDYAAKLRSDHPNRFGVFAAIAPVDVEGSLKEIEYAYDTLKADGIGLLTSYNGKYLGDASFAPVYAELNRRKAVIYVHPLTPACCGDTAPGIPPGSIEYATDSTRTIAHLVFSGMSQKYPDIRWIFSHSGGTLPFLTARFVRQQIVQKHAHLPNGPIPEFQKFYYELAQGNTKAQLYALLEMVKASQVLYGTDYPYRDGAEVNDGIANWKFSAAELRAIENETARKLLPNLKTA
jgi:predicted TIM-barrel fold metal-dependent hydrolase